MKLLLIDNYDSFTYNIVELLRKIGATDFTIVKNDEINIEDVARYDSIIISPGPSLPSQSGIILEIIKQYASTKNILGICLGHQAIAEAFGAKLENYSHPKHGERKNINILEDDFVFKNIPQNISIGLYHSWYVSKENFPVELTITSVDEDGTIMSLKHKKYNVTGLQFHPESYMTSHGEQIIKNWFENN